MTIQASAKHMECDNQARMVFDRMGEDLAMMPKRRDVDFLFLKEDGSGQTGANDKLIFYSEAAGLFDTSIAATSQSPVSLIGYCINTNSRYQLQRIAKGLSWEGSSSTQAITFLSPITSSTSFAPDPQSTLAGGTITQSAVSGTDPDYTIFSQQVFRIEFCYYLKDGTYSKRPIMNTSGNNNLSAAGAPDVSSDATKGYTAGSRWYDNTNKRGYICLSAATNAAVWSPLGSRDISSLVVAIAVLDEKSRKLVSDDSKLIAALSDPSDTDLSATPPTLMASTWKKCVESSTFANSAGIPQSAAAQIRIYQRYFSISPH